MSLRFVLLLVDSPSLNFICRRFVLLLGDSPSLNFIFRRFILLLGDSPTSEILCADVSKQSVCSFFRGVVSRTFKYSFHWRTLNGITFRDILSPVPTHFLIESFQSHPMDNTILRTYEKYVTTDTAS